jgi:hypothetical protein
MNRVGNKEKSSKTKIPAVYSDEKQKKRNAASNPLVYFIIIITHSPF